MAQKRASGDYAQVGALFYDGSLVAVHTSGQRAIGIRHCPVRHVGKLVNQLTGLGYEVTLS